MISVIKETALENVLYSNINQFRKNTIIIWLSLVIYTCENLHALQKCHQTNYFVIIRNISRTFLQRYSFISYSHCSKRRLTFYYTGKFKKHLVDDGQFEYLENFKFCKVRIMSANTILYGHCKHKHVLCAPTILRYLLQDDSTINWVFRNRFEIFNYLLLYMLKANP